MPKGFWTQDKPLMLLAPLAGVTDAAFRRIIAKYGKPDAMFTEFVPAAGLISSGLQRIIHDIWKTPAERPIACQIFGCKPEHFRWAAKFVRDMGFDGVDINMGCPSPDVVKNKAGAALIRQPELARDIVLAAKDGAGDLPVSVKTRIGYKTNQIDEWLGKLLEAEPDAITLHARTREEASKVPARWDVVQRAAEIAREVQREGERTLIIGNGDVMDTAQARSHAARYGCDGVMIGRGIFGNPWLFNPLVNKEDLSVPEVLDVMLEHTALYCELLGRHKPLELMKKHYKAYASGFEGAFALRVQLMAAKDYSELSEVTARFLREASRYDLRRTEEPSEALSRA